LSQVLKDPFNRILGCFSAGRRKLPSKLALSRQLRGLERRPAAAKDEILMSKVTQAVAFAVSPSHTST